MRAEDVLELVKAQPFRPFRMHLVSGKTFDIVHPEFIRVGRSAAYVFFADEPNRPYDRVEIVALVLVERLEPLEPVPAA